MWEKYRHGDTHTEGRHSGKAHTGDAHVDQEQRLELRCHKPRNTWRRQKPGESRAQMLPHGFHKEPTLWTPGGQTSSLQHWETITLLVRPPSWWAFVTAALGKIHLMPEWLVSVTKRVWLFATPQTEPTRLLCPQNSPGKDTGVGCHFLLHLISEYSSAIKRNELLIPIITWMNLKITNVKETRHKTLHTAFTYVTFSKRQNYGHKTHQWLPGAGTGGN